MKRGVTLARAGIILSCLVTGFVFMGCETPIASAQVLYGSIAGTVTDQTKAVVPAAVVTATNTSTGLSRQSNTDSEGYYSISNLPQGNYDLTISSAGFKPVTQKGLDVLINNVTHLDLRLEVGGVSESVTVEASAALLQTNKAVVNVNLESRAIGN